MQCTADDIRLHRVAFCKKTEPLTSLPRTLRRFQAQYLGQFQKKGIQRIVRNCWLYYPKRESFVYNLKDSGSGSSSRTFLAHVITKQRLQQIHTIQNSAFWAKESKWEGISQAAAVRDSANMLQLCWSRTYYGWMGVWNYIKRKAQCVFLTRKT